MRLSMPVSGDATAGGDPPTAGSGARSPGVTVHRRRSSCRAPLHVHARCSPSRLRSPHYSRSHPRAAEAGHRHHGGGYRATTLALDPAAAAALTGLGVTPAPVEPARALPSGELAFPIKNSFRNTLRTGVIRHSGGISLTAGST